MKSGKDVRVKKKKKRKKKKKPARPNSLLRYSRRKTGGGSEGHLAKTPKGAWGKRETGRGKRNSADLSLIAAFILDLDRRSHKPLPHSWKNVDDVSET